MDTLIFLNGCNPEIETFARDLMSDFLIISEHNLGAINALFLAAQFAPSEIIAYSDHDVYYHDGWLDHSLQVLDAFNGSVGMVTATPAGFSAEEANSAFRYYQDDLDWQLHPRVAAFEVEHQLSLTGEFGKANEERCKNNPQTMIRTDKTAALLGAGHFQFIAFKETLMHIAPSWHDQLMLGHTDIIDHAIDDMGLLRLRTIGRHVNHIGSTLDEKSMGWYNAEV